jgi:hypothetical protein
MIISVLCDNIPYLDLMMLQGRILLAFARNPRDHLSLVLERVFFLSFILLLSSLKSANDHNDLSGLDIVNIGHAHSDLFTFHRNPKSTSR